MKKLIVIEGLDGCGKSTQLEILKNRYRTHCITFPYYETDSGRMISAYLRVDSASIMYAADRYTSYRTHWKALYESGMPVISARYVSSNAIYQMTKLDRNEWDGYLDWLCDLEYGKLGMPRPDLTVFLDMPEDISQKLLLKRYGGDESKKDIHERDTVFQHRCREAAMYTAERFGWKRVLCGENGGPFEPETINCSIRTLIDEELNK